MSSQRYADPTALGRMKSGLCPECGQSVGYHSDDSRFWIGRACSLTATGVRDRVAQYREDLSTPEGGAQ